MPCTVEEMTKKLSTAGGTKKNAQEAEVIEARIWWKLIGTFLENPVHDLM